MTLIELLVALAVSTVLIVAITDTARVAFRQSLVVPQALQAIDTARVATTAFVNELRDAAVGSDGSYPIVEASSTEIVFFSPYHMSGNIARIRYFVASSTLYKGVVLPTGSPQSYVLSTEKVTALVRLAATSTPPFTYYDSSYIGSSTPLSQPVKVTAVTYVQISLTVPKADMRDSTTTFTMTTGGAVRNLKTNLGN